MQRGHNCEQIELDIRTALPGATVLTHLEPIEDPHRWRTCLLTAKLPYLLSFRRTGHLVVLLICCLPFASFAWNGTGHRLVAGIAWPYMTPQARHEAFRLLQGTSGLFALDSAGQKITP